MNETATTDTPAKDTHTPDSGGRSRRSFLRTSASGVAVTAAALSGASIAAADHEYDVEVDVVEDLGADDTGSESISHLLDETVSGEDSVKFVFPEGEYLLPRFVHHTSHGPPAPIEKLALIGEGDVTLRVNDGMRATVLQLRAKDLHIENFVLDQTPEDTSTGIVALADDSLTVRNILVDGKATGEYVQTPHWQDDEYDPDDVLPDPFCIVPAVLNADGTGVIEHFRAPDGVQPYSRKGGSWVSFNHAGDLLFKNCEFSNMSDNAIYASPPGIPTRGRDGTVRVENCYFENNNVTAVRLGSDGDYGKDCTVVTEAGEIPATPWGAITSRAGWVWYAFDGYYENFDVIHDHPQGAGILEHTDRASGTLTVRDSRFEFNTPGNVVQYTAGSDELILDTVSLTGDVNSGTFFEVANCEITATDVCIELPDRVPNGFSLTDVTGTISDSTINVGGNQFIEHGDTEITYESVSDDGSCPSPDPSSKIEPLGSDPDGDDIEDDSVTEDDTVTDSTDDQALDDVDEDDGVPGFTVGATTVAVTLSGIALLRRLKERRIR